MKEILFLLVTSFFLLSACGQKGPLYLPEKVGESEEEKITE